ncbi:MAG: CvpA family protein [Clostridia bacterium]|nr:CvpA family protein [Clostridia bacterium]
MAEYYASIFLAIVLVAFSLSGVLKGFVRTVAGFLSYIFGYIIANALYVPVSVLIMRIPFLSSLINPDVEMPEFEPKSGFFEKIGQMASYLFDNFVKNGDDEEVKAILDNMLADFFAKIISFLVLFIVAVLVCKLLILILEKFCELPVLKVANKCLGLIVGFLCGLFVTWILSKLYVNTLLGILNTQWPEIFVLESATTPLMQFFTKYSPIAFILFIASGFTKTV